MANVMSSRRSEKRHKPKYLLCLKRFKRAIVVFSLNSQGVDMLVLKPLIDTVSVEVAESTHKSYQRLVLNGIGSVNLLFKPIFRVMANFQHWVHSNDLLPKEQEVFSGSPHVDSPFWIVAYIMKK